MEFWEGAILIVGGVWLVAHMAKRQNQTAQTVIGVASQGSQGTSNQSNLTTITNQAGGTPTIYGEPLEPLQAPISNVIQMPARVVSPISAQPVYKGVSAVAPVRGTIIAPAPVARPVMVRPMNILL